MGYNSGSFQPLLISTFHKFLGILNTPYARPLTRILIPLHGAEICQKNKVLHMVYVYTDRYLQLFSVKQK